MDRTDQQAAMDWVAARAQQLGREWGANLTPLGWERRVSDLSSHRHRLVVQLHDQRTDIAFEETSLADLSRNVLRQVIVDAHLRLFLNEHLRDTLPRTA